MQVKLSLEEAEGLKSYLMTRPYAEVAYGVQVLQMAIDKATAQPAPESTDAKP